MKTMGSRRQEGRIAYKGSRGKKEQGSFRGNIFEMHQNSLLKNVEKGRDLEERGRGTKPRTAILIRSNAVPEGIWRIWSLEILETTAKPEFVSGLLLRVSEVAEDKTFPSPGSPGLRRIYSK